MTPIQTVAPLFRQVADQLAHIGERDQIHDGRDCQRRGATGARSAGEGGCP
jgi:hypothetical protein